MYNLGTYCQGQGHWVRKDPFCLGCNFHIIYAFNFILRTNDQHQKWACHVYTLGFYFQGQGHRGQKGNFCLGCNFHNIYAVSFIFHKN